MQTQLNVWRPGSSLAIRSRASSKSPAALKAAAMLALVVALAGCSVGSEGLPSGLPGITGGGAGSLTITTTTMPDGIIGRTYNRVVSITGGTRPYTCTNTTPLPPGLVLTTAGNTCVVSGTPTATGLAPFTIQVTDSSLPPVNKSASFNGYNVRAEFTFTPVASPMPDGVVGRTYGAPLTSPTATTDVPTTLGMGPGNGPITCMVTGQGTTGLTQTVPVGTSNCAVMSGAGGLAASGMTNPLSVTFTISDSPITDPANAAVTIVPARTVMATASWTVQPSLSDTPSLNPLPDAVVGRTYGAPRTAVTYTVAGGLSASHIVTASITASPAGTNLACSAPGTTVTCGSGGAAVVGATGAFTFTMTASDGGNSATPAGSLATDTNGNTSHTITVDAAFVLSNPVGGLGNGTEGSAFAATPAFTFTGGLPPAQTSAVTCANGTGVPTGLTAGTGVNICTLTGTPAAGTSAMSPFNVVLTVTDAGNATTPPPAAPAASPGTPLKINKPLAFQAPALNTGKVGTPYSDNIDTVAMPVTTGNQPLTSCMVSGLPAGSGFLPAQGGGVAVGNPSGMPPNPSSSCVLFSGPGGPTMADLGTHTLTFTAMDTASTSTGKNTTLPTMVSLTINNAFSVNPFTLDVAAVGQTYSINIGVSGGILPVTACSVTANGMPLPAGTGFTIAVNTTVPKPDGCVFSGTPTTTGQTALNGATITVSITDCNTCKAPPTTAMGSFMPFVVNPALAANAFLLANGVVNRTFMEKVTVTSTPGTGTVTATVPLSACSVSGLPTGLTASATTIMGGKCSFTISGTPTVVSAPGVKVTITDSTNTNTTSTATTSTTTTLNVRPEFVVNVPASFPDGVVGRTYGPPLTAPLVPTTVSATVGNAPLTACLVTGVGGNPLSASVSGVNCALAGTATLTTAAPLALTFMATDSDILDPVSPFGVVVPRKTITGATTGALTVRSPLTTTPNFTPAPDAVNLRKYGMAPQTPLTFTGTGGIGNAPTMAVSAGAPPAGIACTAAASVVTCSSSSVTAAGGTMATFTVTASDVANSATPAGTSVSDPLRDNTQTIHVDSELVITAATIPNGLLNNAYTGFTFTTVAGTGIPTATLSWVAPAVVMAPCPLGTGSIDGLALSAGGVLSGTPAAASAAPGSFKPQICVFDAPSTATPPNMVSAPGFAQATFTFDVMKNLAYAAGTGVLNSVEVINTTTNVKAASILLGVGASPNGVAITPNGRFAIVTQNGTNKISVIDTILNTQIAGSPVAIPGTTNCGKPAGVGVSPDGVNVYVACDDTTGTNVEEVIVLSAAALTSAPATAFPPVATIVTGAGSKPDAFAFRDATRGYVTLTGSNKLAIINNTGVPAQVGASFSLTAARATPLELTVVPNGAKFYAYIAKENVAGIGAVDVVDVTTDTLSIVTSVDVAFNAKPFGVAGVPGTNARVYVALNGSNQYTVFDNTVTPPVIAAAVPALPYFLPDPTAVSGSGVPVGVAIPPLGTVPATGLPVFITLSGTDGVAVVNNAAALTQANAKNVASPIPVTATSAPGLIRSIPIPK